MIATPSKRISTISRLIICYIAVVIITLPGSHLIARITDNISASNNDSLVALIYPNDNAPIAMFSIKEKTSQFAEAALDAETRIREFFLDADYPSALFSHFNGNHMQPTMAWMKKASQLKTLVLENKFNLSIQLASSSDMDFMMSAFISKRSNGQPLALLNRNWIEYGITHEAFTRLIIELSGFAFDQFLNGANDTKGNEGKEFANDLSSIYEEASDNLAPGFLTLGGRKVLVEF
jgi:hypothetical protein